MALFYLPDISTDQITLPEDESRHVMKVLRMKENDQLELTNGQGLYCKGRITGIQARRIVLDIFEKQHVAKTHEYTLHLVIAPVKNTERFEWFLEKSTEIGVDEITPIITQNSERNRIRTERFEKILVSAMKQSLKVYKPVLNPMQTFESFLSMEFSDCQLFIAYCGDEDRIVLKKAYEQGRNVVILIGPEGDFTAEEIRKAKEKNFKVVSLGDSRLRTETAGVVACHTIEILNQ